MECPLNTQNTIINAESCILKSITCDNVDNEYTRLNTGAITKGVTEVFTNSSNAQVILDASNKIATFTHTDATISFSSALNGLSWIDVDGKRFLRVEMEYTASLIIYFDYSVYKDPSASSDTYYHVNVHAMSNDCSLNFTEQKLKSNSTRYVDDYILITAIGSGTCDIEFRIEVLPLICPVKCIQGYELFNGTALYPYDVISQELLSDSLKCRAVSCNTGSMRTSPFGVCVPCTQICNHTGGEYLKECSNNDYLGEYECKDCPQTLQTNEAYVIPSTTLEATNTSCQIACDSGYQRNTENGNCEACNEINCTGNTFLPLGECDCQDCSTSCTNDAHFINRNCTKNSDIQCSECKGCSANEYQSRNCSLYSDTQCSLCTADCGSGKYISNNCTLYANTQCSNASVDNYATGTTQKPCPPYSSTRGLTGQSRCECNFAFYDKTTGNIEPTCEPLICENQTHQYINWNECKDCPPSSTTSDNRRTCLCNKLYYGMDFSWDGSDYMITNQSSCQLCPVNSTSECLSGYYDYCYRGKFYELPTCKCFYVPNAQSVDNACNVGQCNDLYRRPESLPGEDHRWNVRFNTLLRPVTHSNIKNYNIMNQNAFTWNSNSITYLDQNYLEFFIQGSVLYSIYATPITEKTDMIKFRPSGEDINNVNHISSLRFSNVDGGIIFSQLTLANSQLIYLLSTDSGFRWDQKNLFNVDNMIFMASCHSLFTNTFFYTKKTFPPEGGVKTTMYACDLNKIKYEFDQGGTPEDRHCSQIFERDSDSGKFLVFASQRVMTIVLFIPNSRPLYFLEQNNANNGEGFTLIKNDPTIEMNELNFEFDTNANMSNAVVWSRFLIFTRYNQNTIFLYDMYQNYTSVFIPEEDLVPISKQPAKHVHLLSTWNEVDSSTLDRDIGYINTLIIDKDSNPIYTRLKVETPCGNTEKVLAFYPEKTKTCVDIPCVRASGQLCPINSLSNGNQFTTSLTNCYCIAGFYKSSSTSLTDACTTCPENNYCPRDLFNAAFTCEAPRTKSFTSTETASGCYCLPGFFFESGICKQCPANSWCPGSNLKISCQTETCVSNTNGVTTCLETSPSSKTSPTGSSSYQQCVCLPDTKTKDCIPCAENEICRNTYNFVSRVSLTLSTNTITQSSISDWIQYINSSIHQTLPSGIDYKINTITLVPTQDSVPAKVINVQFHALMYNSHMHEDLTTQLDSSMSFSGLSHLKHEIDTHPKPYTSDFIVTQTCSSSQQKEGDFCACRPGYSAMGDNCHPCPPNFYNSDGDQCLPCGTNATTNGNTASTSCACLDPQKVWTPLTWKISCINQDEDELAQNDEPKKSQDTLVLIGIIAGSVIGGVMAITFLSNVVLYTLDYINNSYFEEVIATTERKIPLINIQKKKYMYHV